MTDNRLHPRVAIDTVVDVATADGQQMAIESINISLSGVMLNATHEQFQIILQQQNTASGSDPVELDISLSLPGKPKSTKVQAHCRAVYVRRIAQNQYYLGLKFLSIERTAEAAVEKYVSASLSGHQAAC